MQTAWLKWLTTLLAGLGVAGFLGTAPAAAQAPKSADRKPMIDKSRFDQHLNDFLRDAIDQGAELYNNGDANACYNLFRSALVSAWYMLDQHPDLRREINTALSRADGQQSVSDRAYTLRAALDATRKGLAATTTTKGTEAKAPVRPMAPAKTTLWQRLGGAAKVRKVIDDFVALAGSDPKVDFDRGGRYKLSPEQMANFKMQMIHLISQETGGPWTYEGRPLGKAHEGMGITDAQFDASVADLRKALEKNNVAADDADALIRIVETTRKAIVQPKGTEGTKPAVNSKPADTKPADKKPATTNPKSENKKTANPRQEVEFPLEKSIVEPKLSPEDNLPFGKSITESTPLNKKPLKNAGTQSSQSKNPTDKKSGDKTTTKDEEKPGRDTIDVKGKITYKGKPLAEASVAFVPKEDSNHVRTRYALTTKDGSYTVRDIQPGEYNIRITPEKPGAIPEKYRDPQTSGLKAKVTRAEKSFDFNLK